MAWSYDCSSLGPSGNFIVDINGGSNFDIGPNESRMGGSGTDHYTDTGTFSLSIISDCSWSITVSPPPPPPFWNHAPGAGTDISVGANGSGWLVGAGTQSGGGYQVYRWNGAGWIHYPGAAVDVGVDPHGNPWVITNAHQIYSHS